MERWRLTARAEDLCDCVPLKDSMLNPAPMVLLGSCSDHEDGVFINRVTAHIREARAACWALPLCEDTARDHEKWVLRNLGLSFSCNTEHVHAPQN